jgi:hypothetical protein
MEVVRSTPGEGNHAVSASVDAEQDFPHLLQEFRPAPSGSTGASIAVSRTWSWSSPRRQVGARIGGADGDPREITAPCSAKGK